MKQQDVQHGGVAICQNGEESVTWGVEEVSDKREIESLAWWGRAVVMGTWRPGIGVIHQKKKKNSTSSPPMTTRGEIWGQLGVNSSEETQIKMFLCNMLCTIIVLVLFVDLMAFVGDLFCAFFWGKFGVLIGEFLC